MSSVCAPTFHNAVSGGLDGCSSPTSEWPSRKIRLTIYLFVMHFIVLLFRFKLPPGIVQEFITQYDPWNAPAASKISYSYAAAALLAIDHWNSRNPIVIPELADLDDDCSVYFPDPKYADSRADGERSVKALWEAFNDDNYPCAVLGPLQEKATFNMQSALAALDIPMMVHFVENDLASAEEAISPGTITMSLSAQGRATAMASYLKARDYLNIASWRSNRYQDMMLAEMIQQMGEELFGINIAVFEEKKPPPGEDEDAFLLENLKKLKENGVTTIYLTSIREPHRLPQFAIYLEQLDMLAYDYFYILPPSVVPPSFGNTTKNEAIKELYGEVVPNSPLDKLLSGTCWCCLLRKGVPIFNDLVC